jgi:hypothetical protein
MCIYFINLGTNIHITFKIYNYNDFANLELYNNMYLS